MFSRFVALVFTLLLGAGAAASSLILFGSARPARAGMLCVRPGGGDGCYTSIQDALAHAQQGDLIRVAAGVYTENVLVTQTVTLQGGWAPDFSLRDLNVFSVTIQPADDTQSVVSIQGLFSDTGAVAPTLDGFVITGGRADLGSNHGGGLRIIDSNALVISNTIRDNRAFLLGGGVWVQRGGPIFQGNHIMNNMVVGLGQEAYGGGVQLENSQSMLVDNLIVGNTVSGTQAYGGGIAIAGSGVGQVILRRNQFISNTASIDLAHSGYGGALAMSNGQALLADSLLISNTAVTGGGGIFIGSLQDCCNLTGHGNSVRANMAAQGGGALIGVGGMISFTHSAFIANLAGQDGGAIYNSGRFSMTNTTISGNSASGMGGGIANFSTVNLVNATVSDNTSADGAGFFNASTVNTLNSLIAVNNGDNCLGVLNSLGHNLEDGGTCALGQPTDMSNTPADIDSLEDNGGPTPTHALAADSPAIDAGDNAACPALDQRGVPRPLDGDGDGQPVCDIGAYEFQIPTSLLILADKPDPSQPGETFTVSFSVTATLGLPSGVVTITVENNPQTCSSALAGGAGSCMLSLTTPGTYTLMAAYVSDDGSFVSSTAATLHTVEAAPHIFLPLIRRE